MSGPGFDPGDPSSWIDPLPRPEKGGGEPTGGGQPEVLELLFGEEALVAPKFQNTVVRGVLHKGSLTVIYGPPKSGKSFLATDLGLAVADPERTQWMEHRIMLHGPVLYVACEGHGGYWKRLRAMIPVDNVASDHFVLARGRPRLIANPDANSYSWVPHPDDIERACKRVFERLGQWPVLVVIDTVFRSFGGANVNDSAHMNAYIAAAQVIADQGIAVVLVHHSTKAGNTPAGSISLIGAADTLAPVKKRDDGTHVWEVDEAKDDADTPPRAFVLEVVDGIPDAFGDVVTSCRVIDQGPAPQEAKPTKKTKEADAPKARKPRPMTPSAEAVYSALVGLFAKPAVPQEREIVAGKPKLRSVTRDQLRDQLKAAGLIEGKETGGMTEKERGSMRDQLRSLATRKEIVMSEEAIAWRPDDPDWWASEGSAGDAATGTVAEAADGGGDA